MTSTTGKFHITDNGPRRCNATKRVCKYASAGEDHFTSKEAATAAYERKLTKEHSANPFGSLRKAKENPSLIDLQDKQRNLLRAVESADQRVAEYERAIKNAEQYGDMELVEQHRLTIADIGEEAAKARAELPAVEEALRAKTNALAAKTKRYTPPASPYSIRITEGPTEYNEDRTRSEISVTDPQRGYDSRLPALSRGYSYGDSGPQPFELSTTSYGSLSPAGVREVAAHLRTGALTAEALNTAYNGEKDSRPEGTEAFDEEKLKAMPTAVLKPASRKPVSVREVKAGKVWKDSSDKGYTSTRYEEVVEVNGQLYRATAHRYDNGEHTFVSLDKTSRDEDKGRQWTEEESAMHREATRYTPDIYSAPDLNGRGESPTFSISTTSYGAVTPETATHIASELEKAADTVDALDGWMKNFTIRGRTAVA